MKVNDLMTTNICFVNIDAGVTEIAKNMNAHNVGVMPVCDKNENLLGIITDRDLVIKSLARSDINLKASDIMSKIDAYTTSDTNIHDAALIMSEKKLKRLPVLEGNRLVGIITLGDLAKKKMLLCEIGDIYNAFVK